MSKYIIINAEAIQKRIDELEIIEKQESMNASLLVKEEIETLKRVLCQSTPLIPEIEKAWNHGVVYSDSNLTAKDYIKNLNLDI